MNVFLTGASGFIGSFLLDCSSINFRCLIRVGSSFEYPDSFIISEFNKSTDFTNAFNDIDVVLHLAGLAHSNSFTAKDFKSVNTDATLNLAYQAAISGVKRFVFISTIGINGNSTDNGIFFKPDDTVVCHNSYSESKHDAEIGLSKIAKETGMELVIIRPTLVYGPKAPGNFGLLESIIKKIPFLPFGIINNQRDFISVYNLKDLIVTCLDHPNAKDNVFLASDTKAVSIREFTNMIAKTHGKNVYQLPFPPFFLRLFGVVFGISKTIDQLIGNLEVDYSHLDTIGWKPPYTMNECFNFFIKENIK